MSRILVTGVNGFVGQHLAKELSENEYEVVGVGGNIGLKEKPTFVDEYIELDLADKALCQKIDFKNIDAVIHLAGLAAVGPSFNDPLLYINVNVGIEINLFERALHQAVSPKFLIISTGGLYDSKAPLPLTEKSEVDPSSPYAVSKIGQEEMAKYYNNRGFECVIARPFNHIGPGQNPGFLVPDVAQQIVDIEKGDAKKLSVGNLDAKRDFTDVRDIAKAYRLLIEKGQAGETYNVCSDKAVSGHEIVAGLLKASNHDIETVQDPDKMRPSDTPEIYGDYSKINKATGWKPSISLDQTLHDVIEDWRNREEK